MQIDDLSLSIPAASNERLAAYSAICCPSLASSRLEQLWVQVSKRWERESQSELYPTDRPSGPRRSPHSNGGYDNGVELKSHRTFGHSW